jgi:hypothetical protein
MVLKPHSTIFQLYRSDQFYWWSTHRKTQTCCKSLTNFKTSQLAHTMYYLEIKLNVFSILKFFDIMLQVTVQTPSPRDSG